jgi:hypothetical protein
MQSMCNEEKGSKGKRERMLIGWVFLLGRWKARLTIRGMGARTALPGPAILHEARDLVENLADSSLGPQ